MTRLLVHVEGQTEESFVNELLAPHLYDCGYTNVSARLIGNSRLRERRGGICSWQAVQRDIVRHLQEDAKAASTTFVDYYALPATGQGAWPGRESANSAAFQQRSAIVERSLHDDVTAALQNAGHARRFIPYVVMHEFEGLLFSDPSAFGRGIGRADLEPRFRAIRAQFQTPEEINDSPMTAPSKRILALMPGYQKPLLGNLAALEIGLSTMRRECPLFDAWISRLESWVAQGQHHASDAG